MTRDEGHGRMGHLEAVEAGERIGAVDVLEWQRLEARRRRAAAALHQRVALDKRRDARAWPRAYSKRAKGAGPGGTR